jgi:hypothetical protein
LVHIGSAGHRLSAQGCDHVSTAQASSLCGRSGPHPADIGTSGRNAGMPCHLRSCISDGCTQFGLALTRLPQKLHQSGLVKANNHLTVHSDDRHPLLTRDLDHFHRRAPIGGDVLFHKGYSLTRKKLFRLVAIRSGVCCIKHYIHNLPREANGLAQSAGPGQDDGTVRTSTGTGVATKAKALVDGGQAVRIVTAETLGKAGGHRSTVSAAPTPFWVHPGHDIVPEAVSHGHLPALSVEPAPARGARPRSLYPSSSIS